MQAHENENSLSSMLAMTKIKRKSGGKLANTKAYYFVHTCMIKRKTIKQKKKTSVGDDFKKWTGNTTDKEM